MTYLRKPKTHLARRTQLQDELLLARRTYQIRVQEADRLRLGTQEHREACARMDEVYDLIEALVRRLKELNRLDRRSNYIAKGVK